MNKHSATIFIYPHWIKFFGLIFVFLTILLFSYRISLYGIVDFAGASFPVAIGLIMIFFSKEKTFDERIIYLKFKSLALSVPVAAVIVMGINYLENYDGYSFETDSWYSISAFEYLTITLTIAIGWFYYLRYRE